MNNWFYIPSLKRSVNLDKVYCIRWEAYFQGPITTITFNEIDSEWISIVDVNDRKALRKKIIGDEQTWEPRGDIDG